MQASERGFTVIELLIGLALSGIVLTGLYTMALSSSRTYQTENGLLRMQADGRTALEFMARELRLSVGAPLVTTSVVANDTITFDRIEDGGYSSGGGTTTQLRDTRQAWDVSRFAPTASLTYTARIVVGTGIDQTSSITDNTATQLIVSPAWGVTLDTTSHYVITTQRRFTRTSTTDNMLRYRIGTGGNEVLAEHISAHSFTLPTAMSIGLSVTARTKSVDPATGQYRTTTQTETVTRRNP